jgi:hypothetical protein
MDSITATNTHYRSIGASVHRDSLAAAAVTFVAGFGVMNVFYFTSQPSNVRGLYSYWSATLGDAVALPVLVGALTESHHLLRSSKSPPPWVGALGLTLGAVGGLLTQIAWVIDPNVDPNWTIPEPHTFTAAGMYHGAFTIVTAGALANLTAEIAWRMHQESPSGDIDPRIVKRSLMVAGGAATAFLLLAVADNLDNLDRSASVATLTALGAAAGLAGMWGWLAWKRKRR